VSAVSQRRQFSILWHELGALPRSPDFSCLGSRFVTIVQAWQSMRYALRQLAKSPGFTTVALLTLALGIGVNTTAFTVLNRLLLQSLPFRDTSTLVQVWAVNPRWGWGGTAPGDYFDEKEQNTVFADIAAYNPGAQFSFAEPGQPAIQLGGVTMTANFFPVVGVVPEIGRLPNPDEEAKLEPVTLLSDFYWRQHYNADPNVLGRSMRLDSKQYTIIGVMPPVVDDPQLFNGRPNFFALDPTRMNREMRDKGWYTVAARLKPGITLKQAQGEINVLAGRFARDHPKTNKDRKFQVVAYPTNQMGDTGTSLTWMTLGLSVLVLLIACVNLANLQLVRTTRRTQEFAIRLALGCPRSTLIGMLLLESMIVSVAGGAIGILVAMWSNVYVARFFETDMPLNLRVIGFTFLISMFTGALFGTVPAWIASRTDINAALKSSGRGSTSDRSKHWLRQGLVVVQLAMALTLLAGAGFFVSGIYKVTHRDLGWDPHNEIMATIALDHDHYGEDNDPRSAAYGDRVVAALNAIPGITSASLSSGSTAWGTRTEPYRIEGQPPPEKGKEPFAGYFSVSPGWFPVYGLHLVKGRLFTDADRYGAPRVAIVNELMAKKCWPGEDPIGKRIGGTTPDDPQWAEVVGVIKDFKGGAEFYNVESNGLRFVRPWAQDHNRFIVICVRTSGPPGPLKEAVRRAAGAVTPDLALGFLSTIDEVMESSVSYFTFLRRIVVQIAVLGLLLSAIGIYGVVATLAAERTKEVGIRMALGAQPAGLIWLFLRNGMQLAGFGAVAGLVASYFLLNYMEKMMPYFPGNDPRIALGVALVLVVVALAACWLPARRTAKVNPTMALRAE
jgi:putative ABC transport system permease protein